jgi:uncharacterized membrane protein YukC
LEGNGALKEYWTLRLEEEWQAHYDNFYSEEELDAAEKLWEKAVDKRRAHFEAIVLATAPLLHQRGFIQMRCCSRWVCECNFNWQRVGHAEEKKAENKKEEDTEAEEKEEEEEDQNGENEEEEEKRERQRLVLDVAS